MSALVTAERYCAAQDFPGYVALARKNVEFWDSVFRAASLPRELAERAKRLPQRWHLLVLSEDWCGDAVNTVPVIARFVEEVANLDLRILARDQNPDLISRHLTTGTRSIPVVMALDEAFVEWGWWGPRPATLQRWIRSEGLHLPREERYRRTRSWYARDRGRTTIEEVVEMLERSERRRLEGRG